MSQAVETKRNERETIFTDAFSSFSVNNVAAAKDFYGNVLGLNIFEEEEGIGIILKGSDKVFLYPKEDHEPASFTVLNLTVKDIDAAVDDLTSRGIEFQSYGGDIVTDQKGIFRGGDNGKGPNIAWFKDPSGNILSVIEGK